MILQTVNTLLERHETLFNTVKDLQEQLSQSNAGSACDDDRHLFFDGKCYFVSGIRTNTLEDAEQFCATRHAELVSINSQEFYDALVNYIRSQVVGDAKSYWTNGRYDPDAGTDTIVVWADESTTKSWSWRPSYPQNPQTTYSSSIHIFLRVDKDAASPDQGLYNHFDDYYHHCYAMCVY